MAHGTLSAIKLSGTVDIRSVHKSFEKIKSVAVDAVALEVDLDEVTEVDLTLLQLMESLRRTALESGTAVRLSHPARGAILEALQRAGFLSDPPDERTRFWLGDTGRAE